MFLKIFKTKIIYIIKKSDQTDLTISEKLANYLISTDKMKTHLYKSYQICMKGFNTNKSEWLHAAL